MTSSIEPSRCLLSPPVPPVTQPASKSFSAARPENAHDMNSQPPKLMSSAIEVTARFSRLAKPRPLVVQRLIILNEFLGTRPKDKIQPWVVAVDGLDRNAVQMMIANLHQHLRTSLGCTVHVVGPARPPIDPPRQLIQHIQDWGAMWNAIAESPLPQNPARPVVFILPLSPWMVTARASRYLALAGTYGTVDLWRWLASHWQGLPRPDISINIEDMADISTKLEILRLQGCSMNTLIVTKGLDGGADLMPTQSRRICFEVEDWIVSG